MYKVDYMDEQNLICLKSTQWWVVWTAVQWCMSARQIRHVFQIFNCMQHHGAEHSLHSCSASLTELNYLKCKKNSTMINTMIENSFTILQAKESQYIDRSVIWLHQCCFCISYVPFLYILEIAAFILILLIKNSFALLHKKE